MAIKAPRGLFQLRKMKSYHGLLKTSLMFCLYLVSLCTRPSIGKFHGVPNGRCKWPNFWGGFQPCLSVWILVIGLMSSLYNLLWDVTIYHVLAQAGKPSDFKKQIKFIPYYFAHYAFRSLAVATFFIYMKVS